MIERGLDINLEIPPAEMERAQNVLADIEGAFERALAKSLNAGMQAMRTELAQRASETLGISARVIRERVWAWKRAKIGQLWATARAGKVGWPLERFPHEQTPEGVQVRLPGGKTIFPHTFVATMPGGHKGVYERLPGWRWKRVNTPRGYERHGLPVRKVRTDAVTDAIIKLAAEPAIMEVGGRVASETLTTETQKRLQEAAG